MGDPKDDAAHHQSDDVVHEGEVEFDGDVGATAEPQETVADELREQLGSMREESDRIAGLDTGTDQVEAAEQFAGDAGRLDEQIGSAARAADDDRG